MQNKKPRKIYWYRDELSVADFLMSHRQALIDEFLSTFSSLEEAVKFRSSLTLDRSWNTLENLKDRGSVMVKNSETGQFEFDLTGWLAVSLRYEHHTDTVDVSHKVDKVTAKMYPTATKLMQHYGDACYFAAYSIIAPQSMLERHTGPENIDGKYVRIHVPLIIPEGDVFFEAAGEEIDWSDIWAFDNQVAHSAHNYSDEWRLVFIIDLDKEAIGLPPGEPYDPDWGFEALGKWDPSQRKPKKI